MTDEQEPVATCFKEMRLTLQTLRSLYRQSSAGAIAIIVTVSLISVLHYVTSLHSLVLHELFKRLYYVPIAIAAVVAGTRGGLATSVLSTVLYVPHVVLEWHAWPAVQAEQYGEVLMFNLVALVTGGLADRLRTQRKRCEDVAAELREAYASLQARAEERQRVDRLVTVGRIASGMVHEIRTPLASILGSLEILETDFPATHPKTEFVQIAKHEVSRLQRVVAEFLDFAQPAPPAAQTIDLRLLVEGAARLARPVLACRDLDVNAHLPDEALMVHVDAEQVQRALLNIMLVSAPSLRNGQIVLTIQQRGDIGLITIELQGATTLVPTGELFEPFRTSGPGQGLGLATAARLIGNQGGAVRADMAEGTFRYVIDLPNTGVSTVPDLLRVRRRSHTK